MDSSPPPDLPKAEWAVMQAVWDTGGGAATELQRVLHPNHGWAYSTVKTMLDRLVQKGYLTATRDGGVYRYAPQVPRDSAVRQVLDDVFDRVLRGSLAPLLDRLVGERGLSRDEARRLRSMLNDYVEGEEDAS